MNLLLFSVHTVRVWKKHRAKLLSLGQAERKRTKRVCNWLGKTFYHLKKKPFGFVFTEKNGLDFCWTFLYINPIRLETEGTLASTVCSYTSVSNDVLYCTVCVCLCDKTSSNGSISSACIMIFHFNTTELDLHFKGVFVYFFCSFCVSVCPCTFVCVLWRAARARAAGDVGARVKITNAHSPMRLTWSSLPHFAFCTHTHTLLHTHTSCG